MKMEVKTKGRPTEIGDKIIEDLEPDANTVLDLRNTWNNKDPHSWMCSDILNWIYFNAGLNGIPLESLKGEKFQGLTGSELCKMSAEEFQNRDPKYGNFLHYTLKMQLEPAACKLNSGTTSLKAFERISQQKFQEEKQKSNLQQQITNLQRQQQQQQLLLLKKQKFQENISMQTSISKNLSLNLPISLSIHSNPIATPTNSQTIKTQLQQQQLQNMLLQQFCLQQLPTNSILSKTKITNQHIEQPKIASPVLPLTIPHHVLQHNLQPSPMENSYILNQQKLKELKLKLQHHQKIPPHQNQQQLHSSLQLNQNLQQLTNLKEQHNLQKIFLQRELSVQNVKVNNENHTFKRQISTPFIFTNNGFQISTSPQLKHSNLSNSSLVLPLPSKQNNINDINSKSNGKSNTVIPTKSMLPVHLQNFDSPMNHISTTLMSPFDNTKQNEQKEVFNENKNKRASIIPTFVQSQTDDEEDDSKPIFNLKSAKINYSSCDRGYSNYKKNSSSRSGMDTVEDKNDEKKSDNVEQNECYKNELTKSNNHQPLFKNIKKDFLTKAITNTNLNIQDNSIGNQKCEDHKDTKSTKITKANKNKRFLNNVSTDGLSYYKIRKLKSQLGCQFLENTDQSNIPKKRSSKILLSDFMKDLLNDPMHNPSCVCWEDKQKGIFRIVSGKSKEVATLWGERKNNPKMNFEKMGRSLRWCRANNGNFSEVPKNNKLPKKLIFRLST